MLEYPFIWTLLIVLSGSGAAGEDNVYLYPAWPRDEQAFKAQTVYFEPGGSVGDVEAQRKVCKVAEYLKANPSAAVEICGHTDDRGSEEHNRWLGQKRAEALRKILIREGVDPNQVDTISYGEDRPAAKGRDAQARSKNRRAEFVLLTPPTTGCQRITRSLRSTLR
jgi:peptidoglycan-associated lipoprotein